jgi:hypothetical protein
MAARRKTVPVTTGIHPPEFAITNWSEIEKACKFKSKLPEAAQTHIKEATRRFLWRQTMEAEAIPLADQKSDLLEIAEATEKLRLHLKPLKDAVAVSIPTDEQIEEGLDREKDRGFQIMHRLERYFDEVTSSRPIKLGERKRFRNFAQEMETLCDFLASLEDAARKAEKATSFEIGSQLRGDAWKLWIADISKAVTDAGLSATTSNDTDKRASTETPFMRLIRELQKLLPEKARRRDHSNQALAKDIQRALEELRRSRTQTAA